MTVVLDRTSDLDLSAYRRVVDEGEPVELDAAALERVVTGRELLSSLIEGGASAYGITTGLGYLRHTEVEPDKREGLQRALLTARAAGLGPPLSKTVVRGVMLLRLNAFLSGRVGVGPDLCRFLADRLNDGWAPVVPSGPYGAAGEIGPLAHLFQTFVGEGRVRVGGEEMPAAKALASLAVAPHELGPKEGLALVNGSPFATALGLELTTRFRALLDVATLTAALALGLTGNSSRPYSRRVGELARDPAQIRIHAQLLELLAGEPSRPDLPQAPVSFRVVPQVFVDALGIAAAHVVNLTEKRLGRLLDSRFSGLPEQLAVDPGRHAGVVSLHKAVVGLAAETRLLAAPASVHALETSSGQEDLQAFTFLAAERADRSFDALETALGCELVALRQAAYLRAEPLAAPALARVVEQIAQEIEPVPDDRTLSADIERARALVRSGRL